jgi:phosphopantetheinyl transferase
MKTEKAAGSAPSLVRERLQFPITIPVEPYLRDHRFNGQVILSAVEILRRLAVSLQSHYPGTPIRRMQSASFDRFLTIDDGCSLLEARHELEIHENGLLCSRLTTIGLVPGKAVRRTKVHAVVDFAKPIPDRDPLPMDLASSLDGIAFEVSASRLYEELVPFGPAYRSLTSLFLSESGALGRLRAPEHNASAAPLGSPFPFDGALHAACAWGQRFRHVTAFPVGFQERTIFNPTKQGGTYICRVLPLAPVGEALRFDIRIYAPDGILCEDIKGVVMKDVFGGRIRPPDWIRIDRGSADQNADEKAAPLAHLRKQCRALSVIEIRTIAEFADRALSPSEQARFEKMGRRRKGTFLAGRLALKRVSRQLNDGDSITPASEIHTTMPDGVRPYCPVPSGGDEIFCSLSHDARFAVAAAADEPVGIDVELVSGRILKTRHLFMANEEMALTESCTLGIAEASIRVWSIKEAVSKLKNKPLPESWRPTRVHEIGLYMSRVTANGEFYTAFHDVVDDHVFTLIKKVSS